jgi:hypothetical protein
MLDGDSGDIWHSWDFIAGDVENARYTACWTCRNRGRRHPLAQVAPKGTQTFLNT